MTPRGTLTVVSTPLGDAQDLSPRAAAALRAADLIVAEDTRSARRLLVEVGAAGKIPIVSCFDANEAARAWRKGPRWPSFPRRGRRSSPIPATGW